ncbi:unnamed protein product [Cylindrotheca closterium]|uniref:Uncharacterized protein n=1 Tax=Cylindrotheca closterium TaxID=2856 RepID=A0AAD2FIY5_9STRA|nr:unnamed protein product [Cylindrotheca closterium]CAJ1950933.1 unnamed protein product [Cylindrotheca closterium]
MNGYAGLKMTSKMATVQKNKEGFTPRQVKAAMEARSAMHILNAPNTKTLDKIFRRYNKAGFQVKTIKCDWAFIPLTDDVLDDMGVAIGPTAAGDHEPTAEQTNRTLKERVRIALARLPYKVVPKVITECLGRRAAELLNVFPQKDSISSHLSPQQLIDIVNINYNSDMLAELGQYVHAIGTDFNNSMEPQSIKAIYIEPTKGQRTGHRVLNLNTTKMIFQPKVVVLPVTDQVIQHVEAWAATKGVTSINLLWPIWITIKKILIEEPMILGASVLIWKTHKNRQKKRLYLSLKRLE